MKKCEKCGKEIPSDYVNLLCADCYSIIEKEIELKKEQDKKNMFESAVKNPDSAVNPEQVETKQPLEPSETPQNAPSEEKVGGVGNVIPDPKFGIKDPNYRENPEVEDKEQILANLAQFIYSHEPTKGRTGKMLWHPQRNMYNFIRNYCMKKIMAHPQYPKYIWKPKIVDVGCGSGVGSNVLSQEADFVWGIDKNKFSLEFAKECFTREKNGIYYSSQVTFDEFDIMTDSRDTMKFDVVVAIEVIEHIYDTDKFLKGLIRFTKRDKHGKPLKSGLGEVPLVIRKNEVNVPRETIEPKDINLFDNYESTEFFISSPNRNFHKIRKDHPNNEYHVREWSSQELVELLRTYFEEVEIMNQKGEPVAEDTSADEVIFFKCKHPK